MADGETLAIVGVGLIGGSLGLAARRGELFDRIIGVGRNPRRLERAVELGAITEFSTDLESAATESDLMVVCTPVELIPAQVCRALAAAPDLKVTDAGSTKGEIMRRIAADAPNPGRFVGSHPLAGSEQSGVEAARHDLFETRLVITTPTPQTDPDALRSVEAMWQGCGAELLRMAPDEHDRAVAATSHVPHVVAAALAAATDGEHGRLVATGWSDTTRVAAGDVELWRQILVDNRAHVLKSLDNFAKVLASFRQALADDDQQRLTELLQAGKKKRDSLGS